MSRDSRGDRGKRRHCRPRDSLRTSSAPSRPTPGSRNPDACAYGQANHRRQSCRNCSARSSGRPRIRTRRLPTSISTSQHGGVKAGAGATVSRASDVLPWADDVVCVTTELSTASTTTTGSNPVFAGEGASTTVDRAERVCLSGTGCAR
jgi:hypothetical protein